jgi:hypothetical protein
MSPPNLLIQNGTYYPPIIAIRKAWDYRNPPPQRVWEVYLPFRQYGKAQDMQLSRWGASKKETHHSLGSAFKRAFRAKELVKAYSALPVYLEVFNPETIKAGISLRWIESEADAVMYILQSDGE